MDWNGSVFIILREKSERPAVRSSEGLDGCVTRISFLDRIVVYLLSHIASVKGDRYCYEEARANRASRNVLLQAVTK